MVNADYPARVHVRVRSRAGERPVVVTLITTALSAGADLTLEEARELEKQLKTAIAAASDGEGHRG